jgi:hypothetical protein
VSSVISRSWTIILSIVYYLPHSFLVISQHPLCCSLSGSSDTLCALPSVTITIPPSVLVASFLCSTAILSKAPFGDRRAPEPLTVRSCERGSQLQDQADCGLTIGRTGLTDNHISPIGIISYIIVRGSKDGQCREVILSRTESLILHHSFHVRHAQLCRPLRTSNRKSQMFISVSKPSVELFKLHNGCDRLPGIKMYNEH